LSFFELEKIRLPIENNDSRSEVGGILTFLDFEG
jgi:hypothetical protein